MKPETIQRARRLLAMLNVLQEEMDELEQDKAFFNKTLKFSGKNFALHLEKQIKEFYDSMNDDANVLFNQEVIVIEELLNSYIKNQEITI